MKKQKEREGNEGVRKSDSKEGSGGKNPNQGDSDKNVRDTIDYPENEDEDFSSGSTNQEPV
jgi:hypothetical protein